MIKINDVVNSKLDGSVKPIFLNAVVVEIIETTFENAPDSDNYNWHLDDNAIVTVTEYKIKEGDTFRIVNDKSFA